MLFRMRRELTPEQRNKLAEIQKAQEQERRAGRPPERVQIP
jgi:Spy/CpxP family protein refolding chaperone